ncbi:hypothetical protein [Vampirovibrio sp.]|uniref:hypothetical protein n=1 Tax=Vampirovibrio sp. TaxID=2717857 RepID=UPI003593CD99
MMPPIEKQLSARVPLILQKMPFWDRTVGNLLHVSEGQNGLSWMSFLRDTSVAWLPKIVVSRSLIEISESTFLEFLESGVIYFSVPVAAKGMHRFFLRQAEQTLNGNLSKAHLAMPVHQLRELAAKPGETLLKKELPRILAVKAATIVGPMVAVGLGCEYLINYGKNLMTAKVFKKDKFSDVVNLSKGTMKSGEESEVVTRSVHRTLATLGLMGGTLLGSLAMARYGHKLPQTPLKGLKEALLKSNWKKLGEKVPENPLAAVVKHFDYDSTKGGFSISSNQLRWYMLGSIPAYADAARDKLERVESVSRLAVIMGYLAFGQQALEKGMLSVIKKYRPDLHGAMIADVGPGGKSQVMRLTDVVDKAFHKENLAQSGRSIQANSLDGLFHKADEAALRVASDEQLKRAITGKNVLFGVPMVVGVLGTGVGVTLLNQFWTKYRFNKAESPVLAGALPALGNQKPVQVVQTVNPARAVYNYSSPFQNSAMPVNRFAGYRPFI